MVTLQKITDDNFWKVINLKVDETQDNFVAPNTISLAQAWLHPDIARPFAIYADDAPVGFTMMEVDAADPEKGFGLWRFMMDKSQQGKGYGRAALGLIIDYLKAAGATKIYLSSDPGNDRAWRLYESVGFVRTGEMDDTEAIAVLQL